MDTLIRPLNDRVLVENIDNKDEVRSGIILPKVEGGGDSKIGIILSVGTGRKTENGQSIPVDVSVGDKIIYSWGEKVEVKGKEYYIVSEGSILGVLNN